MTWPGRWRKAPVHCAPSVVIRGVFRPAEALSQDPGDIVGFQRRIRPVPAEHTQDGEFGSRGVLGEVGEGDFAVGGGAEGRDEQQVGDVPTLAVRGSALLHDEGVEHAAQNDDRERGRAELDEENAERLTAGKGAKLANDAAFEFFCFLVFQAEFCSVVLEREVFEAVVCDRPVEFLPQLREEVVEVGDGVEVGGHGPSDQLISIQHFRTGATPTGACRARRWVLARCVSAFFRSSESAARSNVHLRAVSGTHRTTSAMEAGSAVRGLPSRPNNSHTVSPAASVHSGSPDRGSSIPGSGRGMRKQKKTALVSGCGAALPEKVLSG